MDAESCAGSLGLEVAAWLVTYAMHSTVLLLAALAAFAWIGRAARSSPRVADAAPAWRECFGKVALLGGIATASLQTALGVESFGLRPALVDSVEAPIVAELAQVPAPNRTHPLRADQDVVIAEDAPTGRPSIPIDLTAVPLDFAPAIDALLEAAPPETELSPAHRSRTPPVARTADAIAAPEPEENARVPWITAFLALWAIVAAAATVRRVAG